MVTVYISLTFAGASVGSHDISMRWTGTLIAACRVNTLEGTEVPDALGALVNICLKHTHAHLVTVIKL